MLEDKFEIIEQMLSQGASLSKKGKYYICENLRADKVIKLLLEYRLELKEIKEIFELTSEIKFNYSSDHSKKLIYSKSASIQGNNGDIKLIKNIFNYLELKDIYTEQDVCISGPEISYEKFKQIKGKDILEIDYQQVQKLSEKRDIHLISKIKDFLLGNPNLKVEVEVNANKVFGIREGYKLEIPKYTKLHLFGADFREISSETSFCNNSIFIFEI